MHPMVHLILYSTAEEPKILPTRLLSRQLGLGERLMIIYTLSKFRLPLSRVVIANYSVIL